MQVRNMDSGPILYCGDPHGQFRHIIEAAGHTKASAVVVLGDMEPRRPLHLELAPLIERHIPILFIHGNHDADSDESWANVWESEISDCNVHGRVVELPNGQRLAGLGGVFREAVWYPSSSAAREGAPAYRTMREHAKSTPRQHRWGGDGPPRKHWGTIYPETVDRLADLRADVLITHEAPGYHPNGFELLDTLAQSMGAKVTVHGHHHDRLDSSDRWAAQGHKSFGVGLMGITAIDADGNAEVIVPGELDEARNSRQRYFDAFGGER
jgi:predicted phosphodiesterase